MILFFQFKLPLFGMLKCNETENEKVLQLLLTDNHSNVTNELFFIVYCVVLQCADRVLVPLSLHH